MKTIVIIFILTAFASCTNNSTLTGVNNNDTVELKDEFGRDAYPEIRPDSVQDDSIR
jgi:hypothetical protein